MPDGSGHREAGQDKSAVHLPLAFADLRHIRRDDLLFRRWLEDIEWLGDWEPDHDRMANQAAEVLPPGADMTPMELQGRIDRFTSLLAWPATTAVLSRKRYRNWDWLSVPPIIGFASLDDCRLEVQSPRRYAYRDGGDLMHEGTLDRLVTVWRGDEIVAADVIRFRLEDCEAHDRIRLSELAVLMRPELRRQWDEASAALGLEPGCVGASIVLLSCGAVWSVRDMEQLGRPKRLTRYAGGGRLVQDWELQYLHEELGLR